MKKFFVTVLSLAMFISGSAFAAPGGSSSGSTTVANGSAAQGGGLTLSGMATVGVFVGATVISLASTSSTKH